ncbi:MULTISPECIES: class I adenylate-forming enzyme family protein [unclassified Mycobacterium]|uniref:class I adenylate-forming enzyme family protein n=1 Tax=unclassified Mycobacterium TaxID=2642494 RepID=UPI0029C7F269|nr:MULTISPECIES: AMP-binding protein [unclassified Mycobacterium]
MTTEPGTYWQLISGAAQLDPNRPLLVDQHGRSLTTGEFHDAACACAAAFAETGIGAGSVVSWQLPTTLEALVVMAALARLGAVQNPIVPILREREVGFITDQVATEFLLVPESWRGFAHGQLARALSVQQGFEVVIVDHEAVPTAGALRLPSGDVGALPEPPAPSNAVRWIYYSSGTTAAPKGVRHTDGSVMASSSGVVRLVGSHADDVNPVAFPVSHIGGATMLASCLLTNMRLTLFEAFDPETSPFAIAAQHPTFLGSATPFYVAFLAAQRAHGDEPLFPALRACLAGGAPITPELGRQVRETFNVAGIANSWGLTEFPVATSPAIDDGPQVLDYTVGAPVNGVTVRVVDATGDEVGVGQEGELRLKGPQCFAGYVDDSLNAAAFDDEGWFCTGDLGMVDSDGYVRITGRIKDAIIRNAENISALEVENVLATHPGVADVAVIGVPDLRTGERVCAVVVPVPGSAVSLQSLVEHCSTHGLSRHKHPERVELVDALPRSLVGKVLKKELRATFR